MKKFLEIGEIIKRENIELVIHGGDMFHTPRVSLKYAGEIANLIKAWGVPVYVVPGNHDLYGYNLESIDQTMLGMFAKSKVVNLLTRQTPVTIWKDFGSGNLYDIAIEGQEYYAEIDQGSILDYDMSNTTADLKILAVHSMLLPKAFHPDVAFTLIDDVITDADIIAVGHYHPGWDMVEKNGTKFFNPGSALRVEYGRKGMPKGIIYDLFETPTGVGYNWEYVYLQTAQAEDKVFDVNTKQTVKNSTALLTQFKQTIQNTSALQNVTTIPDMVRAIAKLTNIDLDIVNEALKYITNAQVSADEMLPEVKGFMEEVGKLWVTKVVIRNFQSHRYTVIDLAEGLNVIAGESNKGKTAVMRAILWCLYNDPKGTDFITTGETECSVELYFSNGGILERKRTTSSAGSYIVTKPDGTSQEYSGFNNDIPVEVVNAHQMPEVYLAKDFKCRLNIASQLDTPFLVSESSVVKAAAIGRLIGVQNIDVAIKNVTKDLLGYNKEIKSLTKRIETNLVEIEKYSDLKDLELYIQSIEYIVGLRDKLQNESVVISSLYHMYEDFKVDIQDTTNELNKLPDYEAHMSDIELGLQIQKEIEVLVSLYNEQCLIKTEIHTTEEILAKLPSDDLYTELINKAQGLIEEIELAYNLRQERAKVYREMKGVESILERQQTDFIETAINKTEQELESLLEIVSLYKDYDDIQKELRLCEGQDTSLSTKSVEFEMSIVGVQEEIADLLIQTGSCPVCGSNMDEEHIKHVIAS